MKTKKKSLPVLRDLQEVDQALLRLGKAEATIKHHESVMNDGIQQIRDECDKATLEAREQKELLESQIEAYCIAHKDEFEKVKSRELVHGKVGFRTPPPSVQLLNRKYNWATVLELIKKFPWAKGYFRSKDEVDKETILTAYAAKEITDERLASIGVKIDQAEKFGIEIKWDSLED